MRGVIGEEAEVTCPVSFEWPSAEFPKVFGLGFVPELVDAKVESIRYWLYPRQLDNITYTNHTLTVKDRISDLFVYYGDKSLENSYGFRITELKCYERLVRFFTGSEERMIRLENGVDVSVPMISEVLVYDKEVVKRCGILCFGLFSRFGFGYPFLLNPLLNPYALPYWG